MNEANYKSKPLPVMAIQFNGEPTMVATIRNAMGTVRYDNNRQCIIVRTPYGEAEARATDWIIKGADKGLSVRSNDLFLKTHDPIESKV